MARDEEEREPLMSSENRSSENLTGSSVPPPLPEDTSSAQNPTQQSAGAETAESSQGDDAGNMTATPDATVPQSEPSTAGETASVPPTPTSTERINLRELVDTLLPFVPAVLMVLCVAFASTIGKLTELPKITKELGEMKDVLRELTEELRDLRLALSGTRR